MASPLHHLVAAEVIRMRLSEEQQSLFRQLQSLCPTCGAGSQSRPSMSVPSVRPPTSALFVRPPMSMPAGWPSGPAGWPSTPAPHAPPACTAAGAAAEAGDTWAAGVSAGQLLDTLFIVAE